MSNYNVEIGFINKCCARGAERAIFLEQTYTTSHLPLTFCVRKITQVRPVSNISLPAH